MLDEPALIERKLKRAVTDSGGGHRARPDKPGITNLIDILAVVRGVDARGDRARLRGPRYGDLKAALAAEVTAYLAPVRERYAQLREDVAGLEAVLADGAARSRTIAAATLADVRDAMGVGPPRLGRARFAASRAGSPPRGGRFRGRGERRRAALAFRAVYLAELELDLDVFSGPFDLLLTLVLREEVDLRELSLAEVVVAYLDHLDARGELDLEVTTEFIVLVAALLELKSRLLLPGEELEELLELEPGEAAEELLARMLDARRYRAAAAHLGELLAGAAGGALSRGAAAGAPAPQLAGEPGRRSLGARHARPRARRPAGAAAQARLQPHQRDARVGRRTRRAPARPAALARSRSASTTRCATPTG